MESQGVAQARGKTKRCCARCGRKDEQHLLDKAGSKRPVRCHCFCTRTFKYVYTKRSNETGKERKSPRGGVWLVCARYPWMVQCAAAARGPMTRACQC